MWNTVSSSLKSVGVERTKPEKSSAFNEIPNETSGIAPEKTSGERAGKTPHDKPVNVAEDKTAKKVKSKPVKKRQAKTPKTPNSRLLAKTPFVVVSKETPTKDLNAETGDINNEEDLAEHGEEKVAGENLEAGDSLKEDVVAQTNKVVSIH